jgi:hypothetical protein
LAFNDYRKKWKACLNSSINAVAIAQIKITALPNPSIFTTIQVDIAPLQIEFTHNKSEEKFIVVEL